MTLNRIPYRLALAGGWIDQPFVNKLNPEPFGSMVTVGVEPDFFMMERCGLATGTRKVAQHEWGDKLPHGDPAALVRELYQKENEGKAEPSGSQDMVGLIYPGINRLDYRFDTEGGLFPAHIETCLDDNVMDWLESVVWLLPVCPRPEGYSPLGIQNVTEEGARRLGQTGKDCFDAILAKDLRGLGRSFNECMACWEEILPQTVRHPVLTVDLMEILGTYEQVYPGAMYSGCGGGYLYVVSDEPVPGGFRVRIRRTGEPAPVVNVVSSFDGDVFDLMRTVDQALSGGEVILLLMTDQLLRMKLGRKPSLTEDERRYIAESLKGVQGVGFVDEIPMNLERRAWIGADDPAASLIPAAKKIDMEPHSGDDSVIVPNLRERDRVVVTGCFDYLHSGHLRFFEEAAEYGELHVVVGSDANVRRLKGPGLPMFPEERRRYMVSRLKTVAGAYVSSGEGWMDAEPEIAEIQPRYYVVNEDGDREEKRAFCAERGIEYVVLKREPRAGLPARSSTQLRGL